MPATPPLTAILAPALGGFLQADLGDLAPVLLLDVLVDLLGEAADAAQADRVQQAAGVGALHALPLCLGRPVEVRLERVGELGTERGLGRLVVEGAVGIQVLAPVERFEAAGHLVDLRLRDLAGPGGGTVRAGVGGVGLRNYRVPRLAV
ncbi:hypothetical protein [Streptomyces chrestomyceticus]|uniref:hypothetical protein n=1 Tax=Streptomyces chrestomyceticus TaxID=68185 RepID=UPI003790703E